MVDIIYEYCTERSGNIERKKMNRLKPIRSRQQKEKEKLVKDRRHIRKQWRKATLDDKKGINVLQ